ncbi:MAG: TldD/PmbA family protein [Alphaproteobacteria bacterium]
MAAPDALELLTSLIGRAKDAGADGADAVLFSSAAVNLTQRLGKSEGIERSESTDLGLRVFIGKRQAVVSSTDILPKALEELAERATVMARAAPEDPYCGLADATDLATGIPDLDICDGVEPSTATLEARAVAAEDAARAVAGVTNSEGADASWSHTAVSLATSEGFAARYERSRHGISVAVLAGKGTEMEVDYDFSSAIHGADLDDPTAIGKRAGEKAVKRLGPRKVASATVPVVYDPRVSRSLLRHLAAAINGAAVARGTSFLKDAMGKEIFAPNVTIIDDPHRRRGLGSKPFDGEGIGGQRRQVISNGKLGTWLLDQRSARQLGLKSTGHATRGTSGPPSPSATNLYLEAGTLSPEALIGDIKSGLYLTELIGMGVNIVTGDYSRGASGFWIEDGAITYPVSEITVAGQLAEMFANLAAADDLVFRYGTDAPTLRIDGMTVAGK